MGRWNARPWLKVTIFVIALDLWPVVISSSREYPAQRPAFIGGFRSLRGKNVLTYEVNRRQMATSQMATNAQDLRMAEQNRLKGFLGTANEMTKVAEVIAPKTVEWVRSLTDAEIIPMGVKALGDIADDILVLDEIRQRFRRGHAIEGYANWTEFVEKNSKYGIRTVQRRLNEVHGVREYEKFDPLETTKCRLSTNTQELDEPAETPKRERAIGGFAPDDKHCCSNCGDTFLASKRDEHDSTCTAPKNQYAHRVKINWPKGHIEHRFVTYWDGSKFVDIPVSKISDALKTEHPEIVEFLKNTEGGAADTPTAAPESGDWYVVRNFLSKREADALYAQVTEFPWTTDKKMDGQSGVHFGKSYTLNGGARDGEIPVIDSSLLPLVSRVADETKTPVNYVQCHRWEGKAFVQPHRDPADMVVPMLTLGQSRTFRVGGTMPQGYYQITQSARKVERHEPAEEIVLNHGDLLVFTGGKVLHSMFPADQDAGFDAAGFEYRYSLLFRLTTDAMREYGTKGRRDEPTAAPAVEDDKAPAPQASKVWTRADEKRANRSEPIRSEDAVVTLALKVIDAGYKALKDSEDPSHLHAAVRLAKLSLTSDEVLQ